MQPGVHGSSPEQAEAIQLVGLPEERFDDFMRTFEGSFGRFTSAGSLVGARRIFETDRAVIARNDADEVVGTACNYTFGMSLPHGGHAGCAGVARVGVRADHRRRGVLTRMMRWCLDDARAHGEPLAALWASESPIYGRFGFGPGVPTLEIEVERSHGALRIEGPVDRVQLVDAETALTRLPPLYEQMRTRRAGMLGRRDVWWQRTLDPDPPPPDVERTTWLHAWLPERGYAIYRLHSSWEQGVPRGTVEVADLLGLDPEATAALWQFVIDTDLSARTRAVRRPADEPLLWMLRDQQRAQRVQGWSLMVRVIDLVAACAARGWATDGACVIDLDDAFVPENHGRWRIEVVDGRADCVRVDAAVPADLSLDAAAFASLYLGAERATALLAAARIGGTSAGARTVDQLFAVDLAPWQSWRF